MGGSKSAIVVPEIIVRLSLTALAARPARLSVSSEFQFLWLRVVVYTVVTGRELD